MSHLTSMGCCVADVEALVRALVVMGVNRNQIEVHEQAKQLRTYHAEESKPANVIVRRSVFGHSHSDLGWAKQKDGTYVAYVDDFDYRQGSNEASLYCSKTWQNKLYTHYNVELAKMELESKKIPYTETRDKQDRIQIRAQFVDETPARKVGLY